jgi:hypothetical protein
LQNDKNDTLGLDWPYIRDELISSCSLDSLKHLAASRNNTQTKKKYDTPFTVQTLRKKKKKTTFDKNPM